MRSALERRNDQPVLSLVAKLQLRDSPLKLHIEVGHGDGIDAGDLNWPQKATRNLNGVEQTSLRRRALDCLMGPNAYRRIKLA